MPAPLSLTKSDVARAYVRHHFEQVPNIKTAFEKLRSVQFDPIAPVGCNHDLVLQARVPGYRIGDWEELAYTERYIYDGWDKQASLVPFSGWALRRIFYSWYEPRFERMCKEHPDAVEAILAEISERGPLQPKDFGFQQRREEWKGSWYGPSVTKQALRAMWHAGRVMTAGRVKGQHLYDLPERVVPEKFFSEPPMDEETSVRELVLERHRAVGIVRPNAPPEMWSYTMHGAPKNEAVAELIQMGQIVPVDVDGVRANATPAFLELLDKPSIEKRVVFIAPLDQFLWDRKMVGHVFDFDYVWEIYMPEAKRRWGYYVLPVLYGDKLVARAEFWGRKGLLELRRWHWEQEPELSTLDPLLFAFKAFMAYSSATELTFGDGVDGTLKSNLQELNNSL